MRTTDNNGGKLLLHLLSEKEEFGIDDLNAIANKNLIELQKNNPSLLIFPSKFGLYNDDIEKTKIFKFADEYLTTNNLMGFVGKNLTKLTISSRFYPNGNDYFLHYLLQKVFSINILNFDQKNDHENIWDFLLYLFPYYLKKAYSQGLYKTYIREEHNDANIKGTINIREHIRTNIPFTGKIAYTMREHSFNNPLNQLIRHTIEYIKGHKFGIGILTCDNETRTIVSKICFVTQNRYDKNERQQIIYANLRPISHPYFTEYKILQGICLQILRREKLTFGEDKTKIYGLLFDGAWLWEEYLNTLLKDTFLHPENKTGKHRENLFVNFQPIYPDFISRNKDCVIVGDAKYIPLDKQKVYNENSEKAVSIYYKTITYMYRFNSKISFLIYPANESRLESYYIKNTDAKIEKIGFEVPQTAKMFSEFENKIKQSEKELGEILCRKQF